MADQHGKKLELRVAESSGKATGRWQWFLWVGGVVLAAVFLSVLLVSPGTILFWILRGHGARYAQFLDAYRNAILWTVGVSCAGILYSLLRRSCPIDSKAGQGPLMLMSTALFIMALIEMVNLASEKLLLPVYKSHGLDYARVLDDYRRTIIQLVGGIAVAGTLYFTYKGSRTTEAALRVSQEALAVARETQITDRFTKAVAQLGTADNQGRGQLVVRIGGIYSLERIAKDSTHDHPTIMEILTAYVRTHADWRDREDDEEDDPDERMPRDIEAVITVIQRRNARADKGFLDFSHSYLPGVDFEDVRLREAQFPNARLMRGHFGGAKLKDANFHFADLRGANFCFAKLRGAMFIGADLRRALFVGADMRDAHLHGADLTGATMDQDQLNAAVGSFETQVPDGLVRPDHWRDELSELTKNRPRRDDRS